MNGAWLDARGRELQLLIDYLGKLAGGIDCPEIARNRVARSLISCVPVSELCVGPRVVDSQTSALAQPSSGKEGNPSYLVATRVGVALTTQCPYCIEAHVKGVKAAGASREEITGGSMIAAALRAGAAATHGAMALKLHDQF